MARWTLRRTLVGIVAITLGVASQRADAVVVSPDFHHGAPRPHPHWQLVTPAQSPWSTYLSQQRATAIARLRQYASTGHFAVNHTHPGVAHVFVDSLGRPSALAFLLGASGHSQLVSQIQLQGNFTGISYTSHPGLYAWVLSSGLTQEELAAIEETHSFVPQGAHPRYVFAIEQQERIRLQQHFFQVIQQLEQQSFASLQSAVARLGGYASHAPHDLASYNVSTPVTYVQPFPYANPVVSPQIYPSYSGYGSPVRTPVRIDPYAQQWQPATITPVVMTVPEMQPYPQVQVVQPQQIHIQMNVSVRGPQPIVLE
ncbi:MAG: hypothetical protein Q8Q09_20990 [Deltaproteobacteria bacterium]|nr:hypothetical protein [Deltaproteobacteria bacterium]